MNNTFDSNVKSMTAYEIIMAMVKGLRNQHVEVDMSTFGESIDNVCYGCAATNAICEIYGGMIPASHIDDGELRSNYIDATYNFLLYFELAINKLREGNLDDYNYYALSVGIAQIVNPNNIKLPLLKTETYMENLQPYIDLAIDNVFKL